MLLSFIVAHLNTFGIVALLRLVGYAVLFVNGIFVPSKSLQHCCVCWPSVMIGLGSMVGAVDITGVGEDPEAIRRIVI